MQPTALPAPLPSERGASGGACTRAEILSRIIYHGKQKRHRIFTKSLPNIRCFCGFCLKYLALRRGQPALLAALPHLDGGHGTGVRRLLYGQTLVVGDRSGHGLRRFSGRQGEHLRTDGGAQTALNTDLLQNDSFHKRLKKTKKLGYP